MGANRHAAGQASTGGAPRVARTVDERLVERQTVHLVRLAAHGYSDEEIGKRLHLTSAAVKRCLRSAFAELATG